MRRNIDVASDPLMPQPPCDAAFDSNLDAWILSRYADVVAAFREPALGPVHDPNAQQLPRAQVLDAFSLSRLNEWQRRMEQVAEMLVFDDPVDLVSEFAEPWCLAAAEIVTGSEPADQRGLLAAARIVSAASADPIDERLRSPAAIASAELERYFAEPRVQGPAIPMAGPTFVALSRTMACLLASGWLALVRHPVELARLRADPEQLPRAIEEILRYACLPQTILRRASKPVALCGLRIEKGDRVILRIASANRDPRQFPDPDRIDFSRRATAQLSLGFGPHSCVGAALIRMTIVVATRVFVKKFGAAKICGPVEWQGGGGFCSPARLRVECRTIL